MPHPLLALQEIHTLSSEIAAKRQALREKIRNADDPLIEVIIDSLLKSSSAPTLAPLPVKEVKAETVIKQAKGKSKKAKREKAAPAEGIKKVLGLILNVMDPKVPMGPSEIIDRMGERGVTFKSTNPKVYVGWVLTKLSTGKTAVFRRVTRGKYVPREGTKAVKSEGVGAPFLKSQAVQKVLTEMLAIEGGTFYTSELADKCEMLGRSLANLLSKLQKMKAVKKLSVGKWEFTDRAVLQGLLVNPTS